MHQLAKPWMAACFLSAAATSFATTPAALLGCWRSQQRDVVLADGTNYSTNSDCLMTYGESQATGRCRDPGSDRFQDNRYRVDATDASTLRVTQLDASSGQGTPYEMRYRVEGDWLLLERKNPTATGKQQASFRSLSIRERGDALDAGTCKLRGASPLRLGRTPVSSLHLQAPKYWQPWLTDLSQNRRLAEAVGRSFLIGAFFQGNQQPGPEGPEDFVLVLDDSRDGAEPVSAARFAETRKRFTKDISASARVTCDEAGRICALMSPAENQHIYTELFNIKGRVVMVMVKAPNASLAKMQERARAFTSQLLTDNP